MAPLVLEERDLRVVDLHLKGQRRDVEKPLRCQGHPPTPTPTKAAHITRELVGNTEPRFLPQTPRPLVRIRILTRSLWDLWINTALDCLHQWVSPWLPATITRMLGPTRQQNR